MSDQEFKKDRVYDRGRVTFMARGKGYVMTRYPGCIPFAIPEKEWLALPIYEKPASPKQPGDK